MSMIVRDFVFTEIFLLQKVTFRWNRMKEEFGVVQPASCLFCAIF